MADDAGRGSSAGERLRLFTAARARLLVLVMVGVVGATVLVFFGDSLGDTEGIEEFFTESGVLGPIVFVLLMWLIQPLGVPGVVFMVPAAVVWPWPVAIGLSWIGNLGASFIAFAFARWLGRDWVRERIPPKIAMWNQRFSGSGVRPVVALRVVTGQLPPADWLLGVSDVSVRSFLVGTGIGIIPGIVATVVLGAGFWDLVTTRPGVAVGVVAVALGVVVLRRRRSARGLGEAG